TPEFGELALAMGHAAPHEISAARLEQVRRLCREGRRAFLAEILLERDVIDGPTLVAILERAGGYRDDSLGDGDDVRFGEVAVRKRYATPLEVYNGLRQQRDEAARGEHRPLGEVLLDAGPLTPWELEDVLLTLADLA